jgi:hypothetical protein
VRPAESQRAGLVTLAAWSAKVRRSPVTVAANWRYLPGFPQPAGRLLTGTRLLRETELDAWRGDQVAAIPRRAVELPGGPDQRVTLAAFAALARVSRSVVYRARSAAMWA